MNQPPFPLEELRTFLRALITWAMWEPPGEAVSGEMQIGEFTDRDDNEGRELK